MSSPEVIKEFLDAVHRSDEEIVFAQAADHLARAHGFRWFTYLRVRAGRPRLISTYPAMWTEHYLTNHFETIDPVVAAARLGGTPFFWGGGARPQAEDARATRFFEEAAIAGIVSGITVPLRTAKSYTALFTLATDEYSEALEAHADRILKSIQLCALQFHNEVLARFDRHRLPERGLSKRQVECLSAAANGASAKTIARAVGLKPRTVEYHWEEAKRRLNADSLAQAVASAMREGLIT